MDNKIRLRFAPSPTGFLHIGSLRTVLLNYLIAKKLNGKFILRIEDTDQKRKIEGSEKGLVDILNWVGLKFDEGPGIINGQAEDIGEHGPYVQTERLSIYDKYIKRLLSEGKVYRCFCSSERLCEMREYQQSKKLAPRYDRACRDLMEEEIKQLLGAKKPFVIRQKMPLEGVVSINDELRGEIKFKAEDLDDHVLVKSNGIPTYQFAVVVDDHEMEISHVIRGEDWIPSFPKNILLYKDFGWEIPKFIHMSLSLNKEGGKLSKRQGDVAVEDYREKGYLPEALINFSVLQGWSPYAKATEDKSPNSIVTGDKQPSDKNIEILTLEEAVEKFDYKDMSVSPAIFDVEKLDFFNGYYIRKMDLKILVELCKPYLEKSEIYKASSKKSDIYLKNVISLVQERMKKLSEAGELTEFFFNEELKYSKELLIWKKLGVEEVKNNLKELLEFIKTIPEEKWTKEEIEENIIKFIKDNEKKVGDFLWPMRVSLTGEKASPGPFEVAWVLGKKESIKRIKKAVEIL